MRAIRTADLDAGVTGGFPFGLDTTFPVPGEKYFLVMCQSLYRECFIKNELDETPHGEDLIEKLVFWWAEKPLNTKHLNRAIEGTSLDDDEDGD